MTGIELTALDGTNPLGFLAALGALDVLHRADRSPTLRWTDDVVPTPVLTGAADADDLIQVLDDGRARWERSLTLRGPDVHPLDDAKPAPPVLREWIAATLDDGTRADTDLLAALVSEGAVDGSGVHAKPTHLHFTAGQQRFLRMARELATSVDTDRFAEALFGPWREDSPLPTLSWNSGGERLYALRAVNPATDKKLGVPGADWLALLGLVHVPTSTVAGRDGAFTLHTSGCAPSWKASEFRWPLWSPALGADTVRSVVGAAGLVAVRGRERPPPPASLLDAWSVRRVLSAPIRRTDQGGYGSFGAATVVAEAGA